MRNPLHLFPLLLLLVLISLGIVYGVYTYRQQHIRFSVSCSAYSLDQCPSPSCIVCPPCPECSSLSCQPAAKCKALGIDERWFQTIKNQLNLQKK